MFLAWEISIAWKKLQGDISYRSVEADLAIVGEKIRNIRSLIFEIDVVAPTGSIK